MTGDIQVLHVDDDAAIRDLTAELLESADGAITVRSEADPTAVPRRLEVEPIDCVVSDLEMPGRDGLDLCREVRRDRPRLPFILFTSRPGDDVLEPALQAGVTDYLRKATGTHHYTLLANRIQLLVSRHRALRELDEAEAGAPRELPGTTEPGGGFTFGDVGTGSEGS